MRVLVADRHIRQLLEQGLLDDRLRVVTDPDAADGAAFRVQD
jgi:hypothetical protein